MSTFDALVADLTRDVYRVQPKDALQFCANWFQSRLQEQRERTRDALVRRGSSSASIGIPLDHYIDDALPHINGHSNTRSIANTHETDLNSVSPFSNVSAAHNPSSQGYRHSFPLHNFHHRGSIAPTSSINSQSPFGTLNVPGNALLTNTHTPPPPLPPLAPLTTNMNNSSALKFQVDGSDVDVSISPTSNPRFGYAGFDPSPSTPTPLSGNGDYLHLPSAGILLRRTSISAEPIAIDSPSPSALPPTFPKTPSQLNRIEKSIPNNFIFRDLDDEQLRGVIAAMQEVDVGKDEVVIRQGDVGEYFYVVEKGVLECFIKPEALPPPQLTSHASQNNLRETLNTSPKSSSNNASSSSPSSNNGNSTSTTFPQPGYHPDFGQKVTSYHPGTSFGELALMYGHPRAATILSLTPCTLWRLDRITFRTIILKSAHKRRTMYESFLTQVPLLAGVSMEERSKIADALTSRVVGDGEDVVREGDVGDTFFFVEEGEAVVTKRGTNGESRIINRLKKGDYFGELSLINRQPRAATVSAAVRPTSADDLQPPLKVAALDAAAFTRLLGPLRGPMERRAGENYGPEWSGYRFGAR